MKYDSILMQLYRSEEIELSESNRDEIFYTVLAGSSDLTKERLEKLCEEYGTTSDTVLNEGQQ